MAADPTYPLLPICALLSSALLLGLMSTNFIRHNWNLGVTFLAFWLFWENLFMGINTIIWSDNADIKLYVYCDIVTHLEMFTSIVKPACTLILTRRLYRIASLRSLTAETRQMRITDAVIEWTLGLGLPTLVTGVFYYIIQGVRFQVVEGRGCENAATANGIQLILLESPMLILPLISVVFYCPKILYVFYRHSRETNRFLRTNGSMSRGGYSRIIAVGLIDILLTLPFGIIQTISKLLYLGPVSSFSFYPGWNSVHSDWEPISVSWNDAVAGGTWATVALFFGEWSSIILRLSISALFGFTAEARATYMRGIYAVLGLFGWTPRTQKNAEDMGELQFRAQTLILSAQMPMQQRTSALSSANCMGIDDAQRGARESFASDSGQSKDVEVALQSTRPLDVEISSLSQADGGEFSANDVSSNVKSSHAWRADRKEGTVDVP